MPLRADTRVLPQPVSLSQPHPDLPRSESPVCDHLPYSRHLHSIPSVCGKFYPDINVIWALYNVLQSYFFSCLYRLITSQHDLKGLHSRAHVVAQVDILPDSF